jgi:hypothetical protein
MRANMKIAPGTIVLYGPKQLKREREAQRNREVRQVEPGAPRMPQHSPVGLRGAKFDMRGAPGAATPGAAGKVPGKPIQAEVAVAPRADPAIRDPQLDIMKQARGLVGTLMKRDGQPFDVRATRNNMSQLRGLMTSGPQQPGNFDQAFQKTIGVILQGLPKGELFALQDGIKSAGNFFTPLELNADLIAEAVQRELVGRVELAVSAAVPHLVEAGHAQPDDAAPPLHEQMLAKATQMRKACRLPEPDAAAQRSFANSMLDKAFREGRIDAAQLAPLLRSMRDEDLGELALEGRSTGPLARRELDLRATALRGHIDTVMGAPANPAGIVASVAALAATGSAITPDIANALGHLMAHDTWFARGVSSPFEYFSPAQCRSLDESFQRLGFVQGSNAIAALQAKVSGLTAQVSRDALNIKLVSDVRTGVIVLKDKPDAEVMALHARFLKMKNEDPREWTSRELSRRDFVNRVDGMHESAKDPQLLLADVVKAADQRAVYLRLCKSVSQPVDESVSEKTNQLVAQLEDLLTRENSPALQLDGPQLIKLDDALERLGVSKGRPTTEAMRSVAAKAVQEPEEDFSSYGTSVVSPQSAVTQDDSYQAAGAPATKDKAPSSTRTRPGWEWDPVRRIMVTTKADK